jgi:hypothetical protein
LREVRGADVTETLTVYDPFLGKDVEVSDRLVDRLRGKYACGPLLPNGEPEFGWRQHDAPPIQIEAATEIEQLRAERDAADQVALTAKRYVEAMKARFDEAMDLLRPLAALGPICDHFNHPDRKTVCAYTIKGERRFGPTAGECRAAHDFITGVEAKKS